MADRNVAVTGVWRRFATVREFIGSRLWPIPTVGVLVAVGAGIGLPRIDRHIDSDLPSWTSAILFSRDGNAARTLLDAIATSLITVTSLTFSLTVVTLQLASSQFSPRLLRTFSSDLFVQSTLAVFLATFTYALTVLRSVRTPGSSSTLFVPRISVTVGFLLAVTSVGCLVLFLAHLARQIRVETMLRDVHDDAAATARRMLTDDGTSQSSIPGIPSGAEAVTAPSSGFLVRVDEPALVRAAASADAVVHLDARPGASVIAGTPMAHVWSTSTTPLSQHALDTLRAAVADAVRLEHERTADQDVEFGLRQLTDVATKALSPGINDPTTAIHALSHAAALLCDFARRPLGPRALTDDDGTVRVVLSRPDLADYLDLVMTQPRLYGSSDPMVLGRLFQLLREVAWCAPEHETTTIERQLDRLRRTVDAQHFDQMESSTLAGLADQVSDALAGRWTTSPP